MIAQMVKAEVKAEVRRSSDQKQVMSGAGALAVGVRGRCDVKLNMRLRHNS